MRKGRRNKGKERHSSILCWKQKCIMYCILKRKENIIKKTNETKKINKNNNYIKICSVFWVFFFLQNYTFQFNKSMRFHIISQWNLKFFVIKHSSVVAIEHTVALCMFGCVLVYVCVIFTSAVATSTDDISNGIHTVMYIYTIVSLYCKFVT